MRKIVIVILLVFTIQHVSAQNNIVVKTVVINNQIWSTKNLNTAKFRNGDPIIKASSNSDWLNADKNHQPAWCYYNNDPSTEEIYGKLYNWYAVNDPRGIVPEGWHIPNDHDWEDLLEYLGDYKTVSNKLKATFGWENNNQNNCNGTNESGFCGVPSGARFAFEANFGLAGKSGYYWSSTGNYTAWALSLNCEYGSLISCPKGNGFSVRYIKYINKDYFTEINSRQGIYDKISDFDTIKRLVTEANGVQQYASLLPDRALMKIYQLPINKMRFAKISKENKIGLIDGNYSIVIPPIYDEIIKIDFDDSTNDLFALVKLNNLYGCIDIDKLNDNFKYSIPIKFKTIEAVYFQINTNGRLLKKVKK